MTSIPELTQTDHDLLVKTEVIERLLAARRLAQTDLDSFNATKIADLQMRITAISGQLEALGYKEPT